MTVAQAPARRPIAGGSQGLDEAEAARRLAAAPPRARSPSSRSYLSIVRANVLTVFNLILAVFGAATLAFGDWRDALFLGILLANTAIGITQEVRAKRKLDRLALLIAPTATVVRGGTLRHLPSQALVEGDVVRLKAGDQVVADGRVLAAEGLALDESVVSGESQPVLRHTGEHVRSGAFVVEGNGEVEIEAVGEHSYAGRLLGSARSFRHPRSPLERAVNTLLLWTLALVVGLGTALGYALAHHDASLSRSVSTSTAGVVSLVPEGLVLLVNLTFAVGAVRMARRGVLTQQLNAIESLAAADVICLDKTGTLTEPTLRLMDLVATGDAIPEALRAELTAYAATSPARDALLDALAEGLPGAAEELSDTVPFSSQRRWSALQLPGRTLVLGAPELLLARAGAARAATHQRAGRRVIAIASTPAPLHSRGDEPRLPEGLRAIGFAVLGERLRASTTATVGVLAAEGVELKVLSGDAPETAAAIASDAGIAVRRATRGDELPDDPAELERLLAGVDVIGRISPEGKRRVVESLARSGRYVAMVGDGVNDVPALKAARLAIAQGTGTQIAKSVADLVLLDGNFAAVPPLLAEGRQMLRNLQRVAKLYVAKTAFAAFLILTIGITTTAYPLLPRHFSLAATLTIGIPTFFLALARSEGAWASGRFVREVAQFAIPAGVLVGVGVVASYLFALHDLDLSLRMSRTVATTVLVATGLYLVVALEAHGMRRSRNVAALTGAMGALYVAALALPPGRRFFELAVPSAGALLVAACGVLLAVLCLGAAGYRPGGPPPR